MQADRNVVRQTQASEDSFGPLAGAIADQLVAHSPAADRQIHMSKRLMERVQHSAHAHRKFLTVRHERGDYKSVASGVSMRVLRHDSAVRVDLMRLEPHTPVHWPDTVHAQEILVLEGSLGDGALCSLSRHDLRVVNSREIVLVAGPHGATLYLRQVTDPSLLSANESLWWGTNDSVNDKTWGVASEGVEVRVLHSHGDVVSMLVRIAAGATVPFHAHKLDEDCMMLSGDFFSGDILLRQDDYQLVPKDIDHGDSFSDTGALLYIHGVMPEID